MLYDGKQTKKLLQAAREQRFAIGSFNVFDYMTVEMTIAAAEELGVPVMLSIWDYHNPTAAEGGGPFTAFEARNFMRFTIGRAEASPVPVVLHLDHTPTYEGCLRGIQEGAASVMIDASMKPFEENVALTRKVAEAAHGCGVLCEGEIGHVGGHAISTKGDLYTEVAEAKAYVEQTGIDMVAVSIGTTHGVYTTEPKLNYDRIRELREAVPVPLVMHGSSGLSPEQFKESIAAGICKVNFNTYSQLAGGKAALEAAQKAGEKAMYHDVIVAGKKAAQAYIVEHLKLFGSRMP